MRRAAAVLLLLLATSTSHALPPGGAERGLREGANHRLGDESFVAQFGRAPGEADSEALRMRTHLTHVRAWLGARPPTRPERAAARTRMLGYLDEYIAKGTTPINTRLPWRSPVFIDERGTICAVGYLIERSVGREVAEQIAAAHRHDFLEDIAAAMPGVRAWIEASGLALEELASIQPGYAGAELPWVEQWVPGRFTARYEGEAASWHERGRLRRGQMHGRWTKSDEDGHVVGAGKLVMGSGTWRSTHADGVLLAQGPYTASRPHGTWRFFHRSGNLAAEGTFDRGWRHGRWTFFHDTQAKTPIARGRFDHNSFTGRWEHFDEAGRLLAAVHGYTPDTWRSEPGHLLTIVAGADEVRHQVHLGGRRRLHTFARGEERIYVQSDDDDARVQDAIFDPDGNRLTRLHDGTWEASACRWSRSERRAARAGDVGWLHGLLTRTDAELNPVEHPCGKAAPVPADRGALLDELLAAQGRVRAPVPAFVEAEAKEWHRGGNDLAKLLAETIDRYIQWPHVNGPFLDVYPTLPGIRSSMGQ